MPGGSNLLEAILSGWLRITFSVGFGVALGAALELSGWLEKAAVLLRPFRRMGNIPSVCTSSFLTAFASPRSANSMLASLHADGGLSRRSLILGGISHAFPASSVHIRTSALVLIPLLGWVGAGYVFFQLLVNGLCSASGLFIGRFWREAPGFKAQDGEIGHPVRSMREFPGIFVSRFKRIFSRIVLITFPLYALVIYLSKSGIFSRLNELFPASLANLLPAESLSIISAHLSGVMNAASVAQPFLQNSVLTAKQVFLTLIVGYIISLPLRTLRHSLPSALGIFPGEVGLVIVIYSQLFRILTAGAGLIVLGVVL